MIKFELSDEEVVEVPKEIVEKMSYFKGLPGLKQEDHYDFSEFSIPTMNVLFDYLNGRELLQKEIKGNDEIFVLADYLGDEKFSYEVRKQDTLSKSKIPIMILREHLYQLPSYVIDINIYKSNDITFKEIINDRKKLSIQNLENTFNFCDYNYDCIVDSTKEALYDIYYPKIKDRLIGGFSMSSISEKIFVLDHLFKEKDELKQKFRQTLIDYKLFPFANYLDKEDAYYLYKTTFREFSKDSFSSMFTLGKLYWGPFGGIKLTVPLGKVIVDLKNIDIEIAEKLFLH